MTIKLKDININVAKKINREIAINYKGVPIREDKEKVYIVTYSLLREFLTKMEFVFEKEVEVTHISKEEFIDIINIIYIEDKAEFEREIIKAAIEMKASDLHFEPAKDAVKVRMRIDGYLKITNLLTFNEYNKLIIRIKNMCLLDITEKRRPQDGKMSFNHKDIEYDMRIAILNTLYGEKLVIRILYVGNFNYTLDSLKLLEGQREKLNKIIKLSSGVIIITGPTGSGKSTTLYTILQKENTENTNIMTLEDPVEVDIDGINQIGLNSNINLNFATGLKSILRQDPDVIMVGEIRDSDTAKIVTRAGITGHKVYSTIHTKDPREVYFRLEEMGVEGYLIRDSLAAIISQRLVKKLCSHCKTIIGESVFKDIKFTSYTKSGCNKCNYTGYRGRELIAAIHLINKNMKSKIIDIYNDFNILSNNEMLGNLIALLKGGKITEEDFYDFIEAEEINIV